MKGKCYYCNKELTERTIKRHMKSCPVMKASIEEKLQKNKKTRKQYIIAIKPKYEANEFCIYLSIDSSLGLVHIDQFIRDVWVECCGHLSGFTIERKFYQDEEMNIRISETLSVGEKFEYEYDFGSTTYLILEVIDIINVPKDFTQIEIIARNNETKHICEECGAEAKYFNYEEETWLCENCIDEDDDMVGEFNYCNSPRDGVCGYEGEKEAEEKYLPGNSNKYKPSKKNTTKSKYDDDIFSYDDFKNFENIFGDFLDEVDDSLDEFFSKGIYSFDINKLVKNLNKDTIYNIANNLQINDIKKLKKNQLIDKLLSEYEEAVKKVMNLFDEKRYKILKSIIDNAGIQIIKDDKFDDDMNYLLTIGMLFGAKNNEGEDVVLIPEVIQNLVKEKNNLEYRNIIKSNTEVINLFRGMNRAYGIIKKSDIKRLFERYGVEDSEENRIEAVIREAEYYYDEYEEEEEFIINNEIAMWWELLAKIDESSDYAMIPTEELLGMAEEDWIYASKIGKDFIKEFTNKFNMPREMLEELIESLISPIQENDLDGIINEILMEIDKKDESLREFMCTNVGKLLRNIRLWKYKGATINERVGNESKSEKKTIVGRNEPCTCGSGKKYKQCCGKNGNVIQLF